MASTWECFIGLVTAKWKRPLRFMVGVWECSNKSCYHHTHRQHHVLTTPYTVKFNIINIYREENYTKLSVQLFWFFFFLCVTNLGDYLVSLNKYSIKGHSPSLSQHSLYWNKQHINVPSINSGTLQNTQLSLRMPDWRDFFMLSFQG